MKLRSLTLITAIIFGFASIVFTACQKQIDYDLGPYPTDSLPPIDFASKVTTAKLSGIVTDKAGNPLAGVLITAGNKTTTTNQLGFWSISEALVVKNAGLIKAEKAGYFSGFRTFKAIANKPAFSRIQLLDRISIGTIDAASGGQVTYSEGFQLMLPAGATVVESSNAAYTGPITVYAQWINVGSPSYAEQMPGDLRGLDGSSTKLLTTYGMAAVELYGSSGEKLQIASGKKAKLTFPIPQNLSNTPNEMPMWWFDEARGFWIKDGACVKLGNTYVTEVTHFTYWNVDMPFDNPINLSFTLHNPDSSALTNVYVIIRNNNNINPYQSIQAQPDSTGFASGFAPGNQQLTMYVYAYSYSCNNNLLYSQTFTTGNSDLDLGTITIQAPTTVTTYHLTGIANNCQGGLIQNGLLLVSGSDSLYQTYIITNGVIDATYYSCTPISQLNLTAIDYANYQQTSSPIVVNLPSGQSGIVLQTCQTVDNPRYYISYINDSLIHSFHAPIDSLKWWENSQTGNSNLYAINDVYNQTGDTTFRFGAFQFPQQITGPGTYQSSNFSLNNVYNTQSPITVTVTEFGPIGGYVAGTWEGQFVNTNTAITYTTHGSFRVSRVIF